MQVALVRQTADGEEERCTTLPTIPAKLLQEPDKPSPSVVRVSERRDVQRR
jgi:hypothetical protein